MYKTGLYLGRVASQEMSTSKRGTPQIVLAFELLEGYSSNTIRRVFLYFSPRAERRTREALRELDFYDDLQYLNPRSSACQWLGGRRCQLVCTHEHYAGETREKWSIAIPRYDRTE